MIFTPGTLKDKSLMPLLKFIATPPLLKGSKRGRSGHQTKGWTKGTGLNYSVLRFKNAPLFSEIPTTILKVISFMQGSKSITKCHRPNRVTGTLDKGKTLPGVTICKYYFNWYPKYISVKFIGAILPQTHNSPPMTGCCKISLRGLKTQECSLKCQDSSKRNLNTTWAAPLIRWSTRECLWTTLKWSLKKVGSQTWMTTTLKFKT